MYLLEKMHLVQFYLFSADTLHFGKSSAIVAPNGSGKSAVLDAMQIVLHGGDQNAIELNAQSGGPKTGRSIREYLLGYYRDRENVRPHATCYLTMVFRDTTGKHPIVSAGISLGASIDEPKHRVYGMYILPGVDLSLEEHSQIVQGESVPLAWTAFKELAKDRAKVGGLKPTFLEKGASEFVQSLLFQLRADRARGMDHIAFSKALRNALNLKDVHDASAFVRDRIIESRPINITEFRHQLEAFRELKLKIAEVIERIEVGDGVLESCRKAILTRMRKASYSALAAELIRDQAMEKLDAAQEKATATQAAFEQAGKQQAEAKTAHEAAERQLREITERAKKDPDLLRGQQLDAERERLLGQPKKHLATDLRRIVLAFTTAKSRDSQVSGWGFLAAPWDALLAKVTGSASGDSLQLDVTAELARLRETLSKLQPMLTEVKQRDSAERARLGEAHRAFKNAAEQLARAREGKGDLPPSVMYVRRLLEEQGIQATPVCDLVTVSDAGWAPAIEAYLRSNAYALLVEPGREDDAIAAYEAIPDGYHPFGAKIVKPNPTATPLAGLPTKALARLISGQDEQAVAFVRGRLGWLQQLEKATSRGEDGLTRKGTLVNHGTIERLRMPAADEVLLGHRDRRAQVEYLTREKKRLSLAVDEAEQAAKKTAGLVDAIGPLLTLKDTLENLERWLREHDDQERELDAKQILAALHDNPDLLAMRQLFEATQDRYEATKKHHHEAIEAFGVAKSAAAQARQDQDDQAKVADAKAREASQAMLAPHVDAAWIDERRTEWERNGHSLTKMIDTCSAGKDRESTSYGTQEALVRSGIQQYANRYQFELTADPSDLDKVQGLLDVELKRLRESELANYERQAEDAYGVAVRTFRSRIAASLRSSFDDMVSQLRDLNSIMARLPPFTNDERYHFRWWVNPEYKTLHKFITDVADRGGEDDMFSDPVNTPDEFRALLEDVDGPAQELLRDYRKFYSFEVEVVSQGEVISTLKSRMEKGSGGEHRAPLFVVAGAALAAAYGKLQGDTSGLSLILFDELGDKIDGNNTKAVFEYLASLGLQPVVAAPDDALGKINESLEGYVELYRDGAYLAINHVGIGPEAQELLSSDSWIKHPELLEEEARKVAAERSALA